MARQTGARQRGKGVGGVVPYALFLPKAREPLELPKAAVTIPPPPQQPAAPPSFNLWLMILPPLLMALASGSMVFFSENYSVWMALPMMMGMLFPLFNGINTWLQKRRYEEETRTRQQKYQHQLAAINTHLQRLIERQRSALHRHYPAPEELQRIAANHDRLLWARRPEDEDFLALRVGTRQGQPSFPIELPHGSTDAEDPLFIQMMKIAQAYQKVPDLPALLPLREKGSLVIAGGEVSHRYQVARRLLLDMIVHHSPLDVRLTLIADPKGNYQREWEWLKWVPHTQVLYQSLWTSPLAFRSEEVKALLAFLTREMKQRQELLPASGASPEGMIFHPYWVVVVDGVRHRRERDLLQLTREGYKVGIFVLYIGETGASHYRSRLALQPERGGSSFRFTETHGVTGERFGGRYETAERQDLEAVARALARLKAISGEAQVPLPSRVSLADTLQYCEVTLDAESIRQRWEAMLQKATEERPSPLLRFPFGLRAASDGLEPIEINLLPEELGGFGAYHTVLIGTTGSGKSEFLKTLTLSAAALYPPELLNFFFLDFKGGSTFNELSRLPHVTGSVSNLSDARMVDRVLDAIQDEMERRQKEFARLRVPNIWRYNLERQKRGEPFMPHLLLFLDEFARGLAEFPRLETALDNLTRLGRSLGMYLVLANQDVNAHVDRLLRNVGWRIALKVAKPEELASIVGRGLENPARAGHGYLRSLNDEVTEFQAAYTGFPWNTEGIGAVAEEIVLYDFTVRGYVNEREVFAEATGTMGESAVAESEEKRALALIPQVAREMGQPQAERIYLDPLAEYLELPALLRQTQQKPRFDQGAWQRGASSLPGLRFLWGMLDQPAARRQEPLWVDLADRDGHLWIVGVPGSGKDMAVQTLVSSLAMRYTPEEVQFYLLDMGAGELASLEDLPHTGAVISPLRDDTEVERFQRLLMFLNRELQRRSRALSKRRGLDAPRLVVILNNYAELREAFPDEAEGFQRFVRGGNRVGIHLVFVTNRSGELWRAIANNISRRLVLQQSNRDEYIDLVGRQIAPLPNVRGRGYWVVTNEVQGEVQIAAPWPSEDFAAMRKAWDGTRPEPIATLPKCFSIAQMQLHLPSGLYIPIGQRYEDLQFQALDVAEYPYWLVTGPRESGKTTFLRIALHTFLKYAPEWWHIRFYAFRRRAAAALLSDLEALQEEDGRFRVLSQLAEIKEDLERLAQDLAAPREEEGWALFFDDLDFAFQRNFNMVLDSLAQPLEEQPHLFLMAAGLPDGLRMQMLSSAFLRLLRQGRTGMLFTKDDIAFGWLDASLTREYRRQEIFPGRGFLIQKGRPHLVQTPRWDDCPEEDFG